MSTPMSDAESAGFADLKEQTPLVSQRTRRLLEAPIVPLLVRLAWPNLLVMVAQASTGLIEMWWVAKLGADALARDGAGLPAGDVDDDDLRRCRRRRNLDCLEAQGRPGPRRQERRRHAGRPRYGPDPARRPRL